MSDAGLALSVDILRNLAYLLFLAAAVLLIVAFFRGYWAWTGYAFALGSTLRIIAAILRVRLYAR